MTFKPTSNEDEIAIITRSIVIIAAYLGIKEERKETTQKKKKITEYNKKQVKRYNYERYGHIANDYTKAKKIFSKENPRCKAFNI